MSLPPGGCAAPPGGCAAPPGGCAASFLIGLGNPDVAEYARTRHNAGRRALRRFVEESGGTFRARGNRLEARVRVGGREVLAILPETYMNRSASALPADASAEEVLVLVDDIALAAGRVRIRKSGGAGGHNGLASLIDRLGQGFPRVRIGVGPLDGVPPPAERWAEYVLEEPRGEEAERIAEGEALAAEAVGVALREGLDAAMNRFNKCPTKKPSG